MARMNRRTRAPRRPKGVHSPSRRRALKGIAAYVGDRALGGIIGGTAIGAAHAVAGRLMAPSPMPSVTRTGMFIHSITVGISDTLSLSDHFAIKLIPRNNGVA